MRTKWPFDIENMICITSFARKRLLTREELRHKHWNGMGLACRNTWMLQFPRIYSNVDVHTIWIIPVTNAFFTDLLNDQSTLILVFSWNRAISTVRVGIYGKSFLISSNANCWTCSVPIKILISVPWNAMWPNIWVNENAWALTLLPRPVL